MKNITANNNDYSFKNSYKFSDLVTKAKALGLSLVKNGRDICISGAMIGWILFSISSTIEAAKAFPQAVYSIKVMNEANKEELKELTDEYQTLLENNAIIVLGNDVSCSKEYYFKDENLYDKTGNVLTLDNKENDLYFVSCKMSNETFSNIHLANSNCKTLVLQNSAIDNEFVNYLPESLEALSLEKNNFVTNLNKLGDKCPNIRVLCLDNSSGIDNYDFIYNLPKLEYVSFGDCTHATVELLEFLNDRNIITDLDESDIVNSNKLDKIAEEIITSDMDNKEKIQAVCGYVLDNLVYDIDKHIESNNYPISCCLSDGKVVCISYARLTDELLKRADINSYTIFNNDHAWNLIEEEGKYYYIDTTNIDTSNFYRMLLKYFNITGYYMSDPDTTLLSAMTKSNDDSTLISENLLAEIKEGNADNSIFEKCGSLFGNIGIYLLSFLGGLSITFIKVPIVYLHDDFSWLIAEIKDDYNENLVLQKRKR